MDDSAVTRGSGNVFADLGLPNAGGLLLKAKALALIQDILEARGAYSQAVVAKELGITSPEMFNLLRGRLSAYPLERLLQFGVTLVRGTPWVVEC